MKLKKWNKIVIKHEIKKIKSKIKTFKKIQKQFKNKIQIQIQKMFY